MEITSGMLVVFGLILVALILFISELLPPDITAIGVIVSLAVLGPYTSIDASQAIMGFASPATVTIIAMYILSRGVQETGLVDRLADVLERITAGSESKLLAATVGTTGTLAGIVNNTPVVSVFLPMISRLADRINRSPSRFLMPLSFSAMLGGTLTLLGTSTNFLASDFARRTLGEPLSMFEFTPLGLLVFAVGSAYLLTVGRWLIPDRVRPRIDHLEEFDLKSQLRVVRIENGSSLIGRTAAEVFADEDSEVELLKVQRGEEAFLAPGSDRSLESGDRLILRLAPEARGEIVESYNLKLLKARGVSEGLLEDDGDYSGELMELLVLNESSPVGRTLGELGFDEKHRSTVLAVRRQGAFITRGLDELVLEPGDQLLVLGPRASVEGLADSADLLITDAGEEPTKKEEETESPLDYRAPLSLSILGVVVLLAAVGVMPVVIAALGGVVAMVATGCLTSAEAYEAVSWNVIFLLAGVIPLGIAMEQTGAAGLLSEVLVASADVFSEVGVLWLTYMFTGLLANIITPVASIVLMLPVAATAAQNLGLSVYTFIIICLFASASAFMTPIGYQTNLMVYGPGGYTFMDFVAVGGPLQILLSFVVTAGAVWQWGL